MQQQLLLLAILTVFFGCSIKNSCSKHTLNKKSSKSYRRIYGSTDGLYPHFHAFSGGKCAKEPKSKHPHSPVGHGNSRSFGPIGGLFGLNGDDDPILQSSKYYSMAIPFHVGGTSVLPQLANYEITDFVFQMCNDRRTYPLTFEYFELELPTHLPGHIKVNYNFTTTRDLVAPIEVHFEGYKGILGAMVKFPCMFGLGSCIYRDGCQIFRYSEMASCPSTFKRNNIPCDCPFPKGTYVATSLDYSVYLQGVPEIPGPTPGTDGPYFGRIRLKNKDGETLTCAEATLVVRSI